MWEWFWMQWKLPEQRENDIYDVHFNGAENKTLKMAIHNNNVPGIHFAVIM